MKKTAAKKTPVAKSAAVEILVQKCEGFTAECKQIAFPTWATATAYVRGLALSTVPAGYEKTEIRIGWEDGTRYVFRLDLTRDHAKKEDPIGDDLRAVLAWAEKSGLRAHVRVPDLEGLELLADELAR